MALAFFIPGAALALFSFLGSIGPVLQVVQMALLGAGGLIFWREAKRIRLVSSASASRRNDALSVDHSPVVLAEIHTIARIHLLATDGRTTPLIGPGHYRANHNFGLTGGEMVMGFVKLPDDHPFALGETIITEVTFKVRPELAPEVQVGRDWRLQEGSRLVGTGTVLEIRLARNECP